MMTATPALSSPPRSVVPSVVMIVLPFSAASSGLSCARKTFVGSPGSDVAAELDLEDTEADAAIDRDEDSATEAASRAGAIGASTDALEAELAAVDAMLAIAEQFAGRPDARVRWLAAWIKANMLSGQAWNSRRLIGFIQILQDAKGGTVIGFPFLGQPKRPCRARQQADAESVLRPRDDLAHS